MKIMFYALRPFDEQAYCEPYSKQYGIDYAYTAEVPTPDNLELAKGCDAVSTNPCLIAPEYLEAWAAMGVKFLPCRSIGYDHIPQQKAKELGMRISHSWYPPAGVADYAIMLMLMCNRKVGQILRRADAQDYSLSGKMGRDITRMTVGVIGTGNIGRTVLRHLSGFGCKLLAYDLYPNDEARQYAEYVDLDTLYKSCDIITLHTNATAANTLSQARSEAKRILEQAQADADSLKAQAQQECDAMTAAAAQKRTQTEADCKAMVERAEQEVQQRWQAFDHKANELLDQYRSTDGLPSEEI